MAEVVQDQHLGKYLIHEELGRGGFGTVYRATDTTLDRVVALKILDPLLTRDPGFLERFHREARGAARLEHPNIVPVYEVGEAEGRSFIAMKYLPGRSLDRLLTEGRLPIERTLHILAQVAAALDFAHSKGLIHRDVKPSNILVGPDELTGDPDHATLTDFGLARASDQSIMTSLGQALGTPAYMAPEQLDVDRQTEVGPASDIYSFAVVAYEMLAGRPPFVGPTPAVMVAHLTKEPPSLERFAPETPTEVGEVLRPALAKEMASRPRQAAALVHGLRTAFAPAPGLMAASKSDDLESAEHQEPPTAIRRTTRSGLPWLAWTGMGVATLLAIVAILVWKPWEPRTEPIARIMTSTSVTPSSTLTAQATPAHTATPVRTSTSTATKPPTPSFTPAPSLTPTVSATAPPPSATVTATPRALKAVDLISLSAQALIIAGAWQTSAHADKTAEAFVHWPTGGLPQACAKCHSSIGYLDFLGADNSKAGVVDNVVEAGGGVINCSACHNSATMSKTSVLFPSGLELENLGPEAICAECHQGRESKNSIDKQINETFKLTPADEDTVIKPLVTKDVITGKPITTTFGFRNVHYFSAAATQYGAEAMGGYEYDGRGYVSRNYHAPGFDTCLGCHDAHKLEVRFDKCITCHAGAKSADEIRFSAADFDGDKDVKEPIKAEIAGMEERLYAAMQDYAKTVAKADIAYDGSAYPYFFADANGNGKLDAGDKSYTNWTPRLLKAAYNYQFVQKDPGIFAHNPKYAAQILYDALEDLGKGGIKVNLTGMTRPEVQN